MIAVDTNLLVYAHRRDASWHERAAGLIRDLASGLEAWAIPWPCAHEFLAVVTHPGIFDPPSTPAEALEQLAIWREAPGLVMLAETTVHAAHLDRLVRDGDARGGRVHDARIAAICLEHGVSELWTADRDFGRFPRLATRNPLVGGDSDED